MTLALGLLPGWPGSPGRSGGKLSSRGPSGHRCAGGVPVCRRGL